MDRFRQRRRRTRAKMTRGTPVSSWTVLSDALPLLLLVGVFYGRILCRRCWLVGWMFYHLVCNRSSYLLRCSSFCRFSCVVSARFMRLGVACYCSVLSLGFSCLCMHFFSVSLFLVLCALVWVKTLFGCIKIVSVIAFLLIKNMLRQKKST